MVKTKPRKPGLGCWIFLFLGVLALGLVAFAGLAGLRMYDQARLVQQDALQMRLLLSAPGSKLEQVQAAGPALSALRQDFGTLEAETGPFLWLGPYLYWVPKYGGDLASVQDLMNMADGLLASGDMTYQALAPLLAGSPSPGLDPAHLTAVLLQAQPQLIEARRQLDLAQVARNHLSTAGLTPTVQDLVLKDVDPLMPLLEQGLEVAEQAPRLLGATSEGPKTYLVLALNEDELRASGGLISAAGTLRVDNGHIGNLALQDSYNFDNWAKPYPVAPWELQEYMAAPVLVLRDASWFTNFPTTAAYARNLYSYADPQPVNGVIAFDQQMLVELLGATGPIQLAGVPYSIDANNVKMYMIAAKTPPANPPPDWNRKDFMGLLAQALMEKIFSGAVPPDRLVTVLLQVLNEHHLLLQVDDPSMTHILAQYCWAGAVCPETGDFLMVVDTNVGFNKTNAVVQSGLVYDVDLTKPAAPLGMLAVVHLNNATPVICSLKHHFWLPDERDYPITDCYWNYMRVYTASGTKLLQATPQFVPAIWTILEQDVPARVDD
ncbi:MAG: DUF4012 domain-containing protein, partial [Anaerolineales bacterium]